MNSRVDPGRNLLKLVNGRLAPSVTSLLQSDEAGALGGIKARTERAITGQIEHVSRKVWHLANLPAASDVNRLLRQIANVERQVRELRNEIADMRAEHDAANKH